MCNGMNSKWCLNFCVKSEQEHVYERCNWQMDRVWGKSDFGFFVVQNVKIIKLFYFS